MSWLMSLNATFDNNRSLLERDKNPLFPICHTTQQAHIEVAISGEGEFLRAEVVPREDNTTLIPCTEQSASRSGVKPINHPLSDKLQYLAGDFVQWGGEVTRGYAKDPSEPHLNYMRDLNAWAGSPYANTKLKAILTYVKKGTLIKDLIDYSILHVGKDLKLLKEWDQKEMPPIFQVMPRSQTQADAFIRWVVEEPGVLSSKTWRDKDLIQSWIDYYVSGLENDTCYVTGEDAAVALMHPSKIRNDGDKAKLISGNDNTGLTFRGRFETAAQAAVVSYEVTQKAHNMLRWLVRNQGFRSGDLAIVAWTPGGGTVPSPVDASADILYGGEETDLAYTAEEFAVKLRKRILGFQEDLGDFSNINVMALNSATQGRMAIDFYRELKSSEFLARLEKWHSEFSWWHSYRPKSLSGSFTKSYVGAPSLFDIAEAAYGSRIDAKHRARTIERLLPCVIDAQPFPKDIANSAIRKAINRVAFTEDWEWRKTLTVACSVYKGQNIKEGYRVALDERRTTRDYLYGRLLACADNLEQWALVEGVQTVEGTRGSTRPTNAARMMNRFAERPFSTWRTIELALRPYIARLGAKGQGRLRTMSAIMALFDPEDFVKDTPLSGEFLLGYHNQIMAFWNKQKKAEADPEN